MRHNIERSDRGRVPSRLRTLGRRAHRDRPFTRALHGSLLERLEERALLSSVVGTVYDDANGNGLLDPGEAGLGGVSVRLATFDPATGQTTAVASVVSGDDGVYRFDGVTPGQYVVSEALDPSGRIQTTPTAEHTARSYLLDVSAGQSVVGGTLAAPLAAPSDNWLKALPAGTYEFPLSGDFMLMLGPNGNAPSRVFLTGAAVVKTQAPVITPPTGGDSSGEEGGETRADGVNVPLQMTDLILRGYIASDQHGQGYLGPITITLSAASAGSITSRSDSLALADTDLAINMKVEIPNAFGVGTVLTTATPVPFQAREIARFPAFGAVYNYRGTTPPVSLVGANGAEGGRIMFASLNPEPGYDFGSFAYARIQGRVAIDNGDGTTTPLIGHPVTLQMIAEVSGPSSDGSGQGGEHGSGGPPAGKGEGPTSPITVYTDAAGNYTFTGIGPGGYTLVSPLVSPLNRTIPAGSEPGYTISPLTSGANLTRDFTATFTAGLLNTGTAPSPYPVATHVIVPNFHLGPTEAANTPGQPYAGDGVRFQSAVVAGTDVPVDVQVVGPASGAMLNVWLDLNGDGAWSDGEQMVVDRPVSPGSNLLTLTIPAGLVLPPGGLVTYTRFRLSTQAGLTAKGAAVDGEVEDQQVRIYSPGDLGQINGRAFEDINGDGLANADEPGMDGWKAELVSLDGGQVVASRITAPGTVDMGGVPTVIHGLYHFENVIPGIYEVRLTPPAGGSWQVTSPGSEEGPLAYRFTVGAGQTIGSPPYATTPVTSQNLAELAGRTDTMFVMGQFTILRGGNGGGGHSGSSGETGAGGAGDTGQPVKLSVIGTMTLQLGAGLTSGELTGEITHLRLQGIAVSSSDEGGPITVLGPVAVDLGLFRTLGTIGAPGRGGAGEDSGGDEGGEETSLAAEFALYIRIDATALGMGVLVNTRPIVADGALSNYPMIGTALTYRGGGAPTPLRDVVTGAEGGRTGRLLNATLTPMFGLDTSAFGLVDLSGSVYADADANNVRGAGEPGLAGVVVTVTLVPEESDRPTDKGHGGGGGETTPPPVYITRTDANGRWSITDLGPGTYAVTVTPLANTGISGGDTFSYSVTTQSGQDRGNLDFGLYPLNQAPVLSVPASQVIAEDTALVFSTATGNAITVADPDAGPDAVEVTVTATHGTVTLHGTAGLLFTSGDGTTDSVMTFTGPLVAVNAALDGLRFDPGRDFVGMASLVVTTNDLGNHGFGGARTDTRAVDIAIEGVADLPTLDVADVTVVEGAAIPLNIRAALTDTGGNEQLMVKLHGVPNGAVLSAGTLMNAQIGDWSLRPDQLAGLTIRGPGSGSFLLLVTAVSAEKSNPSKVASIEKWMTVTVTNATPIVTPPATQSTLPGNLGWFALGSFNHPNVGGAYPVTVDWGDGTTTSFNASVPGSLGHVPHAYANTGRYEATVTVRDPNGGSGSSRFSVDVGPTQIASFTLDDGSPQRSRVSSVNLAFTGAVRLDPGAITLRDSRGRTVPMNVSTALVGGRTIATLTPVGSSASGNSLPDGAYTLTVAGDRIIDSVGRPTDAANTGTPGSSRRFSFVRRFGDVNGDGLVNDLDRAWMRYANPSRLGQPNYLWFLDSNGDGRINATDLLAFRRRYRR